MDDYVREIRPLFCPPPRVFQRTVYRPDEVCQFDLWEPRRRLRSGTPSAAAAGWCEPSRVSRRLGWLVSLLMIVDVIVSVGGGEGLRTRPAAGRRALRVAGRC